MVLAVPTAMSYVATIQRLYVIFSGPSQRWNILIKHCEIFTLKILSQTWRECWFDFVKTVTYNLDKIQNALLEESSETADDPQIKSDSQALFQNQINFQYVLSTIICYELLFVISNVNKKSQKIETD